MYVYLFLPNVYANNFSQMENNLLEGSQNIRTLTMPAVVWLCINARLDKDLIVC